MSTGIETKFATKPSRTSLSRSEAFVGAVVLAVGYELFAAWVKGNEDQLQLGAAEAPRPGATAPPSDGTMLRVPPGA